MGEYELDAVLSRVEGKVDQLIRDGVPRAELERQNERVETRFDRLEQKLDANAHDLTSRIGAIESRVTAVEESAERIDGIELRLSGVATSQAKDEAHKEHSAWFWPTIVTLGVGVVETIAVVLVAWLTSPPGG